MQVISEATETVYCAADAAAMLKHHKSSTVNTHQLIYRLDDVSIGTLCSCVVLCINVKLNSN